ncbi:glycosyltransferase family protein [Aliarcobacter butzleri]|uniref:hypothetical protein n=1 Tax=Aliarcobacter butzleri TaxID=28197 RepID=UPI00125FEEAD|nr:hypothetical protein [Aliarcobacter butzleri]
MCVVTYNHEKYIKECLVTQECNFDFEVIVGDNTRAIVQEYAKPIFHEKNMGANYFSINNIARGRYALPGKLQANFMDKTPDCNICFHRVLYSNNVVKDSIIGYSRRDLMMIGSVNSSRKELNNHNIIDVMMDFTANIIQVMNNDEFYGVMSNPKERECY